MMEMDQEVCTARGQNSVVSNSRSPAQQKRRKLSSSRSQQLSQSSSQLYDNVDSYLNLHHDSAFTHGDDASLNGMKDAEDTPSNLSSPASGFAAYIMTEALDEEGEHVASFASNSTLPSHMNRCLSQSQSRSDSRQQLSQSDFESEYDADRDTAAESAEEDSDIDEEDMSEANDDDVQAAADYITILSDDEDDAQESTSAAEEHADASLTPDASFQEGDGAPEKQTFIKKIPSRRRREEQRPSTPTTPERDFQLSSPSDRQSGSPALTPRTKADHILKEMSETEQQYVSDLRTLVSGYKEQVTDVLSADEIAIIFGNISDLLQIHNDFHGRLSAAIMDNSITCVAKTFLGASNVLLSAYTDYYLNYPAALNLLSEKANDAKVAFVMATCQSACGHSLPLADYLLKPVQRLLKYPLFLQSLVNEAARNQDSEVQGQVHRACTSMMTVADNINEIKRDREYVEELSQSVIGWSGRPLHFLGRMLEVDELQVSDEGKKMNQRLVLLFQQALVVCKSKPTGDTVIKRMCFLDKWTYQANVVRSATFTMTPLESKLGSDLKIICKSEADQARWIDRIKAGILECSRMQTTSDELTKRLLKNKALLPKSRSPGRKKRSPGKLQAPRRRSHFDKPDASALTVPREIPLRPSNEVLSASKDMHVITTPWQKKGSPKRKAEKRDSQDNSAAVKQKSQSAPSSPRRHQMTASFDVITLKFPDGSHTKVNVSDWTSRVVDVTGRAMLKRGLRRSQCLLLRVDQDGPTVVQWKDTCDVLKGANSLTILENSTAKQNGRPGRSDSAPETSVHALSSTDAPSNRTSTGDESEAESPTLETGHADQICPNGGKAANGSDTRPRSPAVGRRTMAPAKPSQDKKDRAKRSAAAGRHHHRPASVTYNDGRMLSYTRLKKDKDSIQTSQFAASLAVKTKLENALYGTSDVDDSCSEVSRQPSRQPSFNSGTRQSDSVEPSVQKTTASNDANDLSMSQSKVSSSKRRAFLDAIAQMSDTDAQSDAEHSDYICLDDEEIPRGAQHQNLPNSSPLSNRGSSSKVSDQSAPGAASPGPIDHNPSGLVLQSSALGSCSAPVSRQSSNLSDSSVLAAAADHPMRQRPRSPLASSSGTGWYASILQKSPSLREVHDTVQAREQCPEVAAAKARARAALLKVKQKRSQGRLSSDSDSTERRSSTAIPSETTTRASSARSSAGLVESRPKSSSTSTSTSTPTSGAPELGNSLPLPRPRVTSTSQAAADTKHLAAGEHGRPFSGAPTARAPPIEAKHGEGAVAAKPHVPSKPAHLRGFPSKLPTSPRGSQSSARKEECPGSTPAAVNKDQGDATVTSSQPVDEETKVAARFGFDRMRARTSALHLRSLPGSPSRRDSGASTEGSHDQLSSAETSRSSRKEGAVMCINTATDRTSEPQPDKPSAYQSSLGVASPTAIARKHSFHAAVADDFGDVMEASDAVDQHTPNRNSPAVATDETSGINGSDTTAASSNTSQAQTLKQKAKKPGKESNRSSTGPSLQDRVKMLQRRSQECLELIQRSSIDSSMRQKSDTSLVAPAVARVASNDPPEFSPDSPRSKIQPGFVRDRVQNINRRGSSEALEHAVDRQQDAEETKRISQSLEAAVQPSSTKPMSLVNSFGKQAAQSQQTHGPRHQHHRQSTESQPADTGMKEDSVEKGQSQTERRSSVRTVVSEMERRTSDAAASRADVPAQKRQGASTGPTSTSTRQQQASRENQGPADDTVEIGHYKSEDAPACETSSGADGAAGSGGKTRLRRWANSFRRGRDSSNRASSPQVAINKQVSRPPSTSIGTILDDPSAPAERENESSSKHDEAKGSSAKTTSSSSSRGNTVAERRRFFETAPAQAQSQALRTIGSATQKAPSTQAASQQVARQAKTYHKEERGVEATSKPSMRRRSDRSSPASRSRPTSIASDSSDSSARQDRVARVRELARQFSSYNHGQGSKAQDRRGSGDQVVVRAGTTVLSARAQRRETSRKVTSVQSVAASQPSTSSRRGSPYTLETTSRSRRTSQSSASSAQLMNAGLRITYGRRSSPASAADDASVPAESSHVAAQIGRHSSRNSKV